MRWSNEGYNYPGVYLIVSKLIEAIIHFERDPPMSSPATQQPTPQLFFQTVNSYQRTEALKAAIELEVFTAIGEGRRRCVVALPDGRGAFRASSDSTLRIWDPATGVRAHLRGAFPWHAANGAPPQDNWREQR